MNLARPSLGILHLITISAAIRMRVVAYLVSIPRSENMENMAVVKSAGGIMRGENLNKLNSGKIFLEDSKDLDTSVDTSLSGTFKCIFIRIM
jgi:hypothetical protein